MIKTIDFSDSSQVRARLQVHVCDWWLLPWFGFIYFEFLNTWLNCVTSKHNGHYSSTCTFTCCMFRHVIKHSLAVAVIVCFVVSMGYWRTHCSWHRTRWRTTSSVLVPTSRAMTFALCRYPPTGDQVLRLLTSYLYVDTHSIICWKIHTHVSQNICTLVAKLFSSLKNVYWLELLYHTISCDLLTAFLDGSTLQLFFDLYRELPPTLSPMVSHNYSHG